MLKKQVLIGLLLSIIISLAFVSAVNAYSLYDFVSYIQSLFTGRQEAIRGGLTIAASCKDENAGCSSDSECCSQRCKNPPLNPLATYCARAYCKDGCRFNEVCDADTGGCSGDQLCVRCVGKRQAVDYGCGQGLFERSCDSSVDIGCDERNEGDDCGGGNKCNSEGKCVPSIPTSSANKPCTSDSDCVSSSNDFPTCDNTQDKRTPWQSMCMKCDGIKQAVGSGYNVGACEANCGADSECDGLDPTNDCGGGKKCDSNCKCISVSTTSSSTTTTSTRTTTSSTTTTTTTNCPNSRTSDYGNTICRSDVTCPSISTVNPSYSRNSDNTYTVTFKSSQAEEVNVFVVNGRILEIVTGKTAGYGRAPSYVQTNDDICPSGVTCNPGIIARRYCDFITDGRIVRLNPPASYLDEMACALLPLYLSEKSGTMNTASIRVNHTSSDPMTVYYLYYKDMEGSGNYSKCLEGTKCSKDECGGQYSGCSGDADPSGGNKLTVNSVLCARTTAGVRAWYSCWHAPWELWQTFQALTIPSSYAPTTTTSSTTSTTSGTGTPTGTPTTITGTPTTVTVTATPTTPILPPLPLHCNDCGVGTKCSCELDTTCLEGIWIVKNKDGKPLTVPVVTDIPPIKVEFTPDAKGKIDAIAICFRSDQTQFVRVNKTSAEVKEAMVNCPKECPKDSECICTVNFCNSGMFTVYIEDKLLTSTKFKGTFTGKFTPDTVGTAEVRVDCDDPARSSKVQVTITGTTATTTTTPTSEKKFTGTDFKCSSSGDDRTCSLKYTNKYGTVYLSFVFINSDGDVKYITDPSITIGNGSGTKSDMYTCKGSGSLKVRWVAFSKKDKSGPIAWSTTSEEQRVTC